MYKRQVFRWIKRARGNTHLRSSSAPNVPLQDGHTLPLLCTACEGTFNGWETPTARDVFQPMHDAGSRSIQYGAFFLPFAVSVLWRVLFCNRRITAADDPTRALPVELHAVVDGTLETWRSYLLGETVASSAIPSEAYAFWLDENGSLRGVHSNFALDGMVIAAPLQGVRDSLILCVRLCRLCLVGVVRPGNHGLFQARRIGAHGGSLRRAHLLPRPVMSAVRHGQQREYDAIAEMSEHQLQRVVDDGNRQRLWEKIGEAGPLVLRRP